MLRRIGGEVKTTVAEAQWACCFAFPSLFFVGWPCGAKAAIALLRVEYYFGGHWLSNTWHGRFATGTDEGVRPYTGARLCLRRSGGSANPPPSFAGGSLPRRLSFGLPPPGCWNGLWALRTSRRRRESFHLR